MLPQRVKYNAFGGIHPADYREPSKRNVVNGYTTKRGKSMTPKIRQPKTNPGGKIEESMPDFLRF